MATRTASKLAMSAPTTAGHTRVEIALADAAASGVLRTTTAADGVTRITPPVSFIYQRTDADNVPIGTPNTPVDIPAGEGQTFAHQSHP